MNPAHTRDTQRCEDPDCAAEDALAEFVVRGVMVCSSCYGPRRTALALAGHICCSCSVCAGEVLAS